MSTLTSMDRCDKCGAQAYVRVGKGSMELDFCGHHFAKYGDDLDLQQWAVSIDTRELLTRKAVGAEVS
jgi:ribosomal protein L37AE/L43A